MNKLSVLGLSTLCLVALTSFAGAPSKSPLPTLKLSYEVWQQVADDSPRFNLQTNTLIFIPNADGTYIASPEFKNWRERHFICDKGSQFCQEDKISEGIRFSFVPQSFPQHKTTIVGLNAKLGSTSYGSVPIKVESTLSVGQQEVVLPQYYRMKTQIEVMPATE